MPSIGPQLPPHLTKRKRTPEDDGLDHPPPPTKTLRPSNADEIALDNDAGGESTDSDDGYGPSAPKPPASRASIGPTMPPPPPSSRPTAIGPSLPPSATTTDSSPPLPQKRVLGPAPPPASLTERPPPSSDSSDSDSDYGPALPGSSSNKHARNQLQQQQQQLPPSEAPRRDDWMLAPPPASSGYQERDPTKMRSRKFASGPRPDAAGAGVSSIWTETPEEKARRLADAVLGRGGSDAGEGSGGGGGGGGQGRVRSSSEKQGKGGRDGHADGKIRAYTEQTRGKSLYDEHQAAKKAGKEVSSGGAKKRGADEDEDDDPSKRAFDREKDMGLGMKITASQRKELLNRASDFGGRFQKGNFL